LLTGRLPFGNIDSSVQSISNYEEVAKTGTFKLKESELKCLSLEAQDFIRKNLIPALPGSGEE